MHNHNNAIINYNYGRLQDFIWFSKFLRNYRQFGHESSESFVSPDLGPLNTYRP